MNALKRISQFMTGTDNFGIPPDMRETYKPGGYRSGDFSGVSPFTREGSFVFQPEYVFPWPALAGITLNFMRPLDAGLLRLPELIVGAQPNTVGRGVNSDAATPKIRKATFPTVPL